MAVSVLFEEAKFLQNYLINPKSFVSSQKHQQSQKFDCKDTGPQKIHHPQHKFEGTNTEQTSLHQVSLAGSHQSIEVRPSIALCCILKPDSL